MAEGIDMKPGDLVRYKTFPHDTLHDAGLVGLVLTGPKSPARRRIDDDLTTVTVMWPDRRQPFAASPMAITWDYVDEIEVIDESW